MKSEEEKNRELIKKNIRKNLQSLREEYGNTGEYPDNYQNSERDHAENMLRLVLGVIKRNADFFERKIGPTLPQEDHNKMVEAGEQLIKGQIGQDEYIKKLDRMLKRLSDNEVEVIPMADKLIRQHLSLYSFSTNKPI